MPTSTLPPAITTDDIAHVLDSIRRAESIKSSPLYELTWIIHVAQRSAHTDLEMTVKLALTSIIQDKIIHHRRLYHLPEPSMHDDHQTVSDHIRQDFGQNNNELEAWSILYYRFIRHDLNLKINDLSSKLDINVRQLRRRMNRGYNRLLDEVKRAEAELRIQDKALRLLLKLPAPSYSHLFGLEEKRHDLHRHLTTPTPLITFLVGSGGIGKTSLAHDVVKEVLMAELFDDLIWITLHQAMQMQDFIRRVSSKLDYFSYDVSAPSSPEELMQALRAYMQRSPILIVVDNYEFLINEYLSGEKIIAQLNALIGSGQLLLIGYHRPPLHWPVNIISLSSLSESGFREFLSNKLDEHDLSFNELIDDDLCQKVYQTIGGHPLAGQLLINQIIHLGEHRAFQQFDDSSQDSDGTSFFGYLFQPIWDQFSADTQLTALAIATLSSKRVYWHTLDIMLDLEPDQLDAALTELVNFSFLEVRSKPSEYLMPRLTIQFCLEQINRLSDREEYQELYQKITQTDLVIDVDLEQLTENSDLISVLHNLVKQEESPEFITGVALSSISKARMTGQWVEWRDILSYAITYQEQHSPNSLDLAILKMELGIAHRWLSDFSVASEILTEVINIFGEQGDFIRQAQASVELAKTYEISSKIADAYELYQRAVAIGARQDDSDLYQEAAIGLARIASTSGNIPKADETLIGIRQTFPDDHMQGHLLTEVGMVHMYKGDLVLALDYQKQALDYFQQIGDVPNQARIQLRLGVIYAQLDRLEESIITLEKGRRLMIMLKDIVGVGRALINLGVISLDKDQAMVTTWREILSFQQELGDRSGVAYTYFHLANTHWKLGEHETAHNILVEARKQAQFLNMILLLEAIDNHPMIGES